MRDVVLAFFESEQIAIAADDNGGDSLSVTFAGESGPLAGVVRVDENTAVLVCWSVCPVTVPPARMAAALELVARLNWGHALGNLEIDVDSGTVRMKTSLDVGGEELTEGLVANCVYANIASLEHMLPAIRAVAEESLPVADALARVPS